MLFVVTIKIQNGEKLAIKQTEKCFVLYLDNEMNRMYFRKYRCGRVLDIVVSR